MSDKYVYKCSDCSKSYSSDIIESKMHYLCPDCGKADKNMPLKGVLTIEYDYDGIEEKVRTRFEAGVESGKIWLYPDLWPVDFSNIPNALLSRISLPSNQLFNYNAKGINISLLDETRNPTYSFKDRASILVALKAMELGITEIAAASTGNAGSSLAGICSRLGLKSHIFVPKNIPEAKRIQIQSYGASIYIVDGDYDQAFDLSLEVSNVNKWYNRNTAYNPLTIEGKKSGAYDIFLQTNGVLPDDIFIPVGDGVIISGLYKGFSELLKLGCIHKIPHLIAVQAEGSDAAAKYIDNNTFEYKPAKTIADSISAGAPRNLFMAAESVKNSNGFGITVSDSEILTAQKELGYKFGMLVEPSCASTFAAYNKTIKEFSPGRSVMLLMTGSGLKDFESLKSWNHTLPVLDGNEWKNKLINN